MLLASGTGSTKEAEQDAARKAYEQLSGELITPRTRGTLGLKVHVDSTINWNLSMQDARFLKVLIPHLDPASSVKIKPRRLQQGDRIALLLRQVL
jgi:hypothetical protein